MGDSNNDGGSFARIMKGLTLKFSSKIPADLGPRNETCLILSMNRKYIVGEPQVSGGSNSTDESMSATHTLI